MIPTKTLDKCLMIAFILVTFSLWGCGQPAPTRVEIVTKYPSVDEGSLREENLKIICPFVRMLERSGYFDEQVASQSTLTVTNDSLVNVAKDFGCASIVCGFSGNFVGSQQGSVGIDLERLHDAGEASHECGLTFPEGGTEVDDAVRQATLDRLFELRDENDHIAYEDLQTVKSERCAAQGVEATIGGLMESKIVYAYLGGLERGYIEYSDVVKLLHAEMPATKTDVWINAATADRVDRAHNQF